MNSVTELELGLLMKIVSFCHDSHNGKNHGWSEQEAEEMTLLYEIQKREIIHQGLIATELLQNRTVSTDRFSGDTSEA